MTQLVPIQLEDGTEIYIEATENVDVPPTAPGGHGNSQTNGQTNGHFEDDDDEEEVVRGGQKGWGGGNGSRGITGFPGSSSAAAAAAQSFKAIEGTIRTYTTHTLSAFKDMAHGNVDKVTLQFGIRVGGEAGVPYVTKGTAESNLSITVECSFDKDKS